MTTLQRKSSGPIDVTFIPASGQPAFAGGRPAILAWLESLPLLEREWLLGRNWKIRPAAGLYFKREWCTIVDHVPADLDVVRYWDLAATDAGASAVGSGSACRA
jgi:hypothetical protein